MLCPSNEQLAAALRASKPSPDDAMLADHLAECADCRARLDSMVGGGNWLDPRLKAARQTTFSNRLVEVMNSLQQRCDASINEEAPHEKLEFLQPGDDPTALGSFGAYKVLKHIASGGMGIVLQAHDVSLNRIVAIKILPPRLAAR